MATKFISAMFPGRPSRTRNCQRPTLGLFFAPFCAFISHSDGIVKNLFKAFLLVASLIFAAIPSAHADIIAQWNFNSVPADGSPGTGTTAPSVGSGTASLIGGVTSGFSAGSTNDPATSSDD